VNQIVKLFSLNPRFGGLIMAKIVQFMMSKQMFQRQLAAALFEELADPVYEQITKVLEESGGEEQLTSIFVVEPFAELLGEKTTDFDKIVESSMKDMDLEKMLMHIRNPQNYLYSKNEKVASTDGSCTIKPRRTRPTRSMRPIS
jgi:ABC-type iron transport system FetAB ATPase subunit